MPVTTRTTSATSLWSGEEFKTWVSFKKQAKLQGAMMETLQSKESTKVTRNSLYFQNDDGTESDVADWFVAYPLWNDVTQHFQVRFDEIKFRKESPMLGGKKFPKVLSIFSFWQGLDFVQYVYDHALGTISAASESFECIATMIAEEINDDDSPLFEEYCTEERLLSPSPSTQPANQSRKRQREPESGPAATKTRKLTSSQMKKKQDVSDKTKSQSANQSRKRQREEASDPATTNARKLASSEMQKKKAKAAKGQGHAAPSRQQQTPNRDMDQAHESQVQDDHQPQAPRNNMEQAQGPEEQEEIPRWYRFCPGAGYPRGNPMDSSDDEEFLNDEPENRGSLPPVNNEPENPTASAPDRDYEALAGELEEAKEEIDNAKNKLADTKEYLKRSEMKLAAVKRTVDHMKGRLDKAEDELGKAKEEARKLRKYREKAERRKKKIRKMKATNRALEARIVSLEDEAREKRRS